MCLIISKNPRITLQHIMFTPRARIGLEFSAHPELEYTIQQFLSCGIHEPHGNELAILHWKALEHYGSAFGMQACLLCGAYTRLVHPRYQNTPNTRNEVELEKAGVTSIQAFSPLHTPHDPTKVHYSLIGAWRNFNCTRTHAFLGTKQLMNSRRI